MDEAQAREAGRDPHDPGVWTNIGRVLYRMGRREEARAAFERVTRLLEHAGGGRIPAEDAGLEPAEVERYVVTPGQASSYMIGELKILELREKARRALGNQFLLKDFHSMVLTAGALPLELLERETDAFIARSRGP